MRGRRSTSGGIVMRGTRCLKHWSRVQSVVALSSAEAELHAGVRTAGEVLSVQALAEDFGMRLRAKVLMDANAAIAIMTKEGLSKIRHVETKWFWTQEALRRERFVLEKVGTKDNLADVFTKRLDAKTAEDLLGSAGFRC